MPSLIRPLSRRGHAPTGSRATLDWPGHGRSPRSAPETAVGFGELLGRVLDDLGGEHVLPAAIERADEASRSPHRAEVYGSLWRSFTDPDHDARPLAAAVRCPTLLAWGTHDPVLPWRLDGRRARTALSDTQTVTFAGAGHQPFIERPDEFLSRTTSFLSTLRTAMAR